MMHESQGLVSRLAVASCRTSKLRALGKSVESCPCPVLSWATLARDCRQIRRSKTQIFNITTSTTRYFHEVENNETYFLMKNYILRIQQILKQNDLFWVIRVNKSVLSFIFEREFVLSVSIFCFTFQKLNDNLPWKWNSCSKLLN